MNRERLGFGQLAIFSLPVVLFQAIEIPWRSYLPALFSETVGLSLATVGTLMMAIRLFDMVLDPLVGWASDRFPTRFGQRGPWMAAGAPLIMLGAWQVFFVTPGSGLAMLAFWCLVLHVGYTLTVTPHGGWGLEISADHHERTRVMGAKVWFAAAGMPFIILLPSVLERGFSATRAVQVEAMGLLLILLTPLTLFLVLRTIREPAMEASPASRAAHPLRQIAAMLKNRELTTILILYALVGIADASSAGTFIFFVEQTLALRGWASTLMLIQSLVALVALPLWGLASQRLGKRQALIGVFGWQAASMLGALILPAGQMLPLLLFLILRNACWGGDYMLLRSMVADVSGEDAERGFRRSGSYYALFNITLKLAMSLGIGMALWFLARAGFAPGEPNSAQAREAVRLAYVLPSCLSGLAGALILLRGIGRRACALPQAGA